MEIGFSRKFALLSESLLVIFTATFAFGQGISTGSLSGTVEDPQHAVIAGATVTATQAGTNVKISTQSTETGFFTIAGLQPGTYTVAIEAPKFSKLTINNVQVNANITTSLGGRALSLGTQEVVTVEGSAPLVQTDTMNVSGTFDTKKAADLPIGNGFDSLALFQPGMVDTADQTFSNSNGPGVSSNGQRGRSNNFQIDGQSNNDNSVAGPSYFFGNQDAIQEVQVLTNYDAQYGRNMGSVVNYVTKAGTNSFHGTAYEIYNGNWADSMENQEKSPLLGFCLPSQSPTADGCTQPVVPRYVDNRFGGTLGGPIVKDKLWFFGSGNFERQRVGASPFSSGSSLTPDTTGLAQLAAAFPNNAAVAALQGIGPNAVTAGGGVTYSNPTTILVSPLVPPIVAGVRPPPGNNVCAQAVPDPSCVPVEFARANRNLASLFNDYEGTGRVDWQIDSKDRLFGRYVYQNTINTNVELVSAAGNAQGEYVDVPADDQAIGVEWDRNATSNLLNQARFSFSHLKVFFEGGAYPNCVAGTVPECPTNIAIGSTIGTPILGLGQATNMPQGRLVDVYSYQDNITWTHGKHTFKFGGEYDHQHSPNTFLPNVNGAYSFRNFNYFLANLPTTVRLTEGNLTNTFSENDLAFYGQDDWRVRDNFTLTLGLRWEWFSQAINLLHDSTVARESNPATAAFDPGYPLALRTVPHIPQDLNNFGPVIGFAYTPRMWTGLFGQDKTVIRGGFRVAYDPEFYNMFLNVATSTPTVNAGTLTAGSQAVLIPTACPGCLPASGLGGDVVNTVGPLIPTGPGVFPGSRTWTTVSPNFHNPYTEQWNLGIQREITPHIVAEVRYVGNHSVSLFQDVNGNPALQPLIDAGFGNVIPSGLSPCVAPTYQDPPPPQAPKSQNGYADCSHTNVLQRANTGFSIYHSLQSQLRISNWHGVTAGVQYTFSHNIDNVSEIFSTAAGGNTLAFPQNPFNGNQQERSNSGLDFPNVASIYMLYDLPWYRSQHGVLGHLLGGFSVNPTWRFASGQPYTVVSVAPLVGLPGSTICDPTFTFSATFAACRPFVGNPSAPIDTVGICLDPTQPNCAMVTYTSFLNAQTAADFVPTTPSNVHWIYNETGSQTLFGTPFGNSSRNSQRGDTVNQVNLAVLKNTKITERFSFQLRAVLYNVMNRQFRGVPDPVMEDETFNPTTCNTCSFGNTFFNSSGGNGSNTVFDGLARRRLEVGLKIIF